MDVVEILLREDGDEEQWLEPRNLSWCLRLIHYLLTLSLLFILLISYILGIICVPILVLNQESFILHLNSYLEESTGVSPEPFTGNSTTLFGYTKVLQLVFNSASFVIRLAIRLFTPPLGVLANLMTNDAELIINCNTLCVTKECSRIFGEGLWTISSRFLLIKS